MAAPTKAAEQLKDWTEVVAQAFDKSGVLNVAALHAAELHIDMAQDSVIAHDGTKVRVQVSSNTAGDEDWHTLREFIMAGGTAASEALSGGGESPAATLLEVASTIGFAANGVDLFLKDAVLTDSEIVYQIGFTTDQDITILDGLTNAHDDSDTLWNIVDQEVVELPPGTLRARVVINNDYDATASSIVYRIRATKVTG